MQGFSGQKSWLRTVYLFLYSICFLVSILIWICLQHNQSCPIISVTALSFALKILLFVPSLMLQLQRPSNLEEGRKQNYYVVELLAFAERSASACVDSRMVEVKDSRMEVDDRMEVDSDGWLRLSFGWCVFYPIFLIHGSWISTGHQMDCNDKEDIDMPRDFSNLGEFRAFIL